jgi:ABC-type multidrug transport system fused ATPase/permease subunit
LPREDRERPDAIRLPRLTGRVEFDRVSFSFGDGPRVLEDISFIAEPGQMVALVGPSGSGKSTLASLMPLFRYPTSGVIRFDGLDARRLELDGLRRQIAVVLQDAVVLSGSVMENLRYGRLDATDDEIREAARLAHADEFIAALPHGYRTVLAEAGRSLSGGQRQRLSLARAFLRDAPIVVLDEPTAALDTVSEQHILQGVERLRQGRTVFVIAHRLVTVRQAEVILVLDRGRIAARGRHDDLMRTSPLYHRLATAMIEPRP